jgi:rhamnogalacturonyl hydrolase YesR
MRVQWVCKAALLAVFSLTIGAAKDPSTQSSGGTPAEGQIPAADLRAAASNEKRHFGDMPEDGGPLAKLPGEMKHDAIVAAARKVADWELARSKPYFGNSWTWCPLYFGLMQMSRMTGDAKYTADLPAVGEKYQWKLGPQLDNADDHCIGQLYLDLYLRDRAAGKDEPRFIAATRSQFDELLSHKNDAWSWCDALFMSPPTWARLSAATGDRKYLDYMNHNWWETAGALYDPQEHLFYRDAKYLGQFSASGSKIFWSRGNGWVVAAIARVLQFMPADYPDRGRYVTLLQEMSQRLAGLQDKHGLWHSSLLEPGVYPLPENSGSALIAYAMAWGVNQKILDRATYEPVIARAWAGLVAHIYADGRLGCIQQTGGAPAYYRPTASFNYGVGAFLMAAAEIEGLADSR